MNKTSKSVGAKLENLAEKIPDTNKVRKQYQRVERASLLHLYKLVVVRWRHLSQIRFQIVGWFSLIIILLVLNVVQNFFVTNKTTVQSGVAGGLYSEGIVGPVTEINPIFASTTDEKAMSRLMYRGLFNYDDKNILHGDLVQEFTVSADQKTYTFSMKQNQTWNDGEPITVADAVWTINLIKNTVVRSNYYSAFTNIAIDQIDEQTFSIRTSLSTENLLETLTVGILPAHKYVDISPSDIRSEFYNNTHVVSGPYQYSTRLDGENSSTYEFLANEKFHLGSPKISAVQIQVFEDGEAVSSALKSGKINTAAGLRRDNARQIVEQKSFLEINQVALNEGIMAIFNNTSQTLKNPQIREALLLAVDKSAIRRELAINDVEPLALDGPMIGYPDVKQATYDPTTARDLLFQFGYALSDGKLIDASGNQLRLSLITLPNTDYTPVAELLAGYWRELGIAIDIQYPTVARLQSSYLIPRAYDILLTGLRLNSQSDFALYWHGSGATATGLNYANYSSLIVDLLIEDVKSGNQERQETIVRQWIKDTPAIALYTPYLYYVSNKDIAGLTTGSSLVDPSWRFSTIHNWTVLNDLRQRAP